MTQDVTIGIIGGSGVYNVDGVRVLEEKKVQTPFGEPSEVITICEISGKKVAFLPRHGKGHQITPTALPVKANIWALKSLGVRNILSVSAVGSLREEYAPRHFVIPSQIIDRTRLRENTFFTDGIVGHVAFAEPFCSKLSNLVASCLQNSKPTSIHTNKTMIVMEGPAFSTRAESHLYRSWGADIIGMTALPEAKLAREAEIAYATIAMVTDYDCWKEDESDVDITTVIGHMKHNVEVIKKELPRIIESIPNDFASPAHEAAKFAIITSPDLIPGGQRERLDLFYGKYWN